MPDMVKNISQIFADSIFFVPDYQRGYAWEERQWNDLLEDIELLPEGRSHFTGTLVLRPRNYSAGKILDKFMHAYQPFDIIDGQQRLTSIVILLKAIHTEMSNLQEFDGLRARLQETYLYGIDRNDQPFTKLTLNADSHEFFANHILGLHPGIGVPTIRSHERLLGAQQHFTAYLSRQRDELGDGFAEWLQRMYARVILQLNLIVYPVDDELDAGTIFETMNDRGKPLTEFEKVKNYLLYLSGKLDLTGPHELSKMINETWKYIYEHLMAAGLAGRENEDQLLRAHWLMVYDYDTSHWQNARSIKSLFSLRNFHGRHPELLQALTDYLHILLDATTAYCDINRPGFPGAFKDISDQSLRSQIILWGNKLTRLGVSASFIPLLIAVRVKAKDDGTTYLKTLQLLEKYSFRVFSWRRARSNAGQPYLFQQGNRFFRNPNRDGILVEVADLISYYCPDNLFNERFQRETENWYQWVDINYFLYEYEHHLAAGHPVQLTWETLNARPKASSIEHILPQTPQDTYWLERFTSEQQQRWTHDVANLTLTYDNSGLSNKPFPLKKGAPGIKGTYADSPLFIERILAQVPEWTEEALQVRRNQIVAWAKERWKVDAPKKPKVNEIPGSMEAMLAKAEQYGMRGELEALHRAATRLGMWPTIRKGIQYRSPHNYRLSMIVVYIYTEGFHIKFYHENFTHFKSISMQEVGEILQIQQGGRYFDRKEIHNAVEALDRFYDYVQDPKK